MWNGVGKVLSRAAHNMGDSDDEREFGKRRDKFHTERRGQDRGDDDRRGGFGGLQHFSIHPVDRLTTYVLIRWDGLGQGA